MHIDDLRDTDDMSLNLSLFCGTSISKLLTAVNDCENVQKVKVSDCIRVCHLPHL